MISRNKFFEILRKVIGTKAKVIDNSGMVSGIAIEGEDVVILGEFYDRPISFGAIDGALGNRWAMKNYYPFKKILYVLFVDIKTSKEAVDFATDNGIFVLKFKNKHDLEASLKAMDMFHNFTLTKEERINVTKDTLRSYLKCHIDNFNKMIEMLGDIMQGKYPNLSPTEITKLITKELILNEKNIDGIKKLVSIINP